MIVQEHFLKKLRSSFELNIYEVKIWTALLSRGIATAGELSDISGVPRSRTYDILESLERKGFIVMRLGRPITYLAVKPEEVLKRAKDTIRKVSDRKINTLDKVKEDNIFRDLELLFRQGIEHVDPTTLSGFIKGRDNIHVHLGTLLQNTEKSIIIATTEEEGLRYLRQLKLKLKKLAKKGVKIKIAIPRITPEIKEELKDLQKSIQLKVIDDLRARFIVIDKKEIMFMVSDDKNVHESYDAGVWVSTPYFANALETMFNLRWGK